MGDVHDCDCVVWIIVENTEVSLGAAKEKVAWGISKTVDAPNVNFYDLISCNVKNKSGKSVMRVLE